MEPPEVASASFSPSHTQPPRGLSLFWRTFILLSLLMLCSTVVWLMLFSLRNTNRVSCATLTRLPLW